MKRFIGLILTVIMLLSSVSVFAAMPTEEQLNTLKQCGIMTGDPDGNMRLDDTITRAEAVKMIIAAQNYVNSSTPEIEKSEFPDVWETHWAKMYINMAKALGIVEGDENGNFNPEDDITNEEIVKMLIVVLGYRPMADTVGGFPGGYLSTSARIGLTNGLVFKTNTAAKRGDIAVLFANALNIPLMGQISWSTDGDTEYVIFDGNNGIRKATLLSEYFGVTEDATEKNEETTENTETTEK